MSTRRDFLEQTVAAGVVLPTLNHVAHETDAAQTSKPFSVKMSTRMAGARVKSIKRREETILRLGGSGDNFHMSWAADDRQYISVCDGRGWSKDQRPYNSRMYTASGEAHQATFGELHTYPELVNDPANPLNNNRYYGFGTLALDGRLYQFLSTPNHLFSNPDLSPIPGARFVGVKLIYSPDNGRSWCNQDGSTPVKWEPWESRSHANMLFFQESQEAFSLISVLQMGRNYAANRDGYVYLYSPNGNTEGTMNQLVLIRVPKDRLLERRAYEYFAGVQANEDARWTAEFDSRAVVHTFPRGWVNSVVHPWAWVPSITFNPPLGIYMMTSWGTRVAEVGKWFQGPSYLGLWTAVHPWGPWHQVHEETAWLPGNDSAARAFAPQISPKWIAADGRSFWLVWSDFQGLETERCLLAIKQYLGARTDREKQQIEAHINQALRCGVHYGFNCQRVDLVVA